MASIVEIARAKVGFYADDNDLVRGINRVDQSIRRNQKALREAQRTYRRFTTAITNTVKQLTSFRTIFATFAGGGAIGAGIRQITNDLAFMENRARQLRISVEELQHLRFIGEDAQIEVEDITQALVDYNDRLGDAIDGNEEFARLFQILGIDIANADRGVRGLLRVIDAINNLEDAAQASFIVNSLLSETGVRLLSIEDAIGQYNASLQNNIVVSSQAVRRGRELNQAIGRLGRAFRTGIQTAVAESAGEIERLIEVLTPTREQMDRIVGGVRLLVENLHLLVDVLKLVIGIKIVAFFGRVLRNVNALAAALVVLVANTTLGSKAIVGFTSAVSAAASATGIAGLAARVKGLNVVLRVFGGILRGLLAATGIGLLIIVISTLIEHWDRVTAAVRKFMQTGIGMFIGSVIDFVQNLVLELFNLIGAFGQFTNRTREVIENDIETSRLRIANLDQELAELGQKVQAQTALLGSASDAAEQFTLQAIRKFSAEIKRLQALRDKEIINLRQYQRELDAILLTAVQTKQKIVEQNVEAQEELNKFTVFRQNLARRLRRSQRATEEFASDSATTQGVPADELIPFLDREELRKQTEFTRFIGEELKREADRQRREYDEHQRQLGDINDRIADSFGNLARGVAHDFDNIKDVARQFVLDLRNILIDELVFAPVRRYFRELLRDITGEGTNRRSGGIGGFLGNLLRGLVPGLQGGGLADGFAIVGERGPELIDFRTPTRVYNNTDTSKILNNNPNVTLQFDITAGDVVGMRQLLYEIGPQIVDQARAAVAEDLSRPSTLRTAAGR